MSIRLSWNDTKVLAAKDDYLQSCKSRGIEPTALGLYKELQAVFPYWKRKVDGVTLPHTEESGTRAVLSTFKTRRKKAEESLEKFENTLPRMLELIRADSIEPAYAAQLIQHYNTIKDKKIPEAESALNEWPELESGLTAGKRGRKSAADATDIFVANFADDTLGENELLNHLDKMDKATEDCEEMVRNFRAHIEAEKTEKEE
jgi:hypothetical protein